MPILALLVAGATGAVLARILRLPLWALTGSLMGSGALALSMVAAGPTHRGWGLAAQLILGSALGSELSRGSVAHLRGLWVPAVVAIGTLLGVGIGLGLLVSRASGLEPITTLYGLAPGGISEMVAAAGTAGANAPLVAGMHLVRMLVVVAFFLVLARFWSRSGEE